MNEYVVPAVMPDSRFGLAGIESIKQNVQIIATTYTNTVVLDRELGIDSSIIDQPEIYAMVLMQGALIEAVEAGEPRAEVVSIEVVSEQGVDNQSGKAAYLIKFRERSVT